MAGPLSAPAGYGRAPHDKCQDRENCHGPGCRVRTGKTHHKRTGTPSVSTTDRLAQAQANADSAAAENQENAA